MYVGGPYRTTDLIRYAEQKNHLFKGISSRSSIRASLFVGLKTLDMIYWACVPQERCVDLMGECFIVNGGPFGDKKSA